jgi:hypothetical protein
VSGRVQVKLDTKKLVLFAPLLIVAICRPATAAAEFQYHVMPIAGITGISQSVQKKDPGESKYGGMINAQYADLFFDAEAQKNLSLSFRQEVEKRFPTSVIGPNQVGTSRSGKYAFEPFDQAQCKPTFTANYKDVFAIAVGISRLSAYFNTYSEFTQVLVPVTYTIRFVKMNGATVVFSKSQTVYTSMTSITRDLFTPGTKDMAATAIQKLKAAVLNDGLAMVQQQVDLAAKSFSPKQSEVTVAAREGEYLIFDRGSEVGFSSGEDFDAIDIKGQEFSFSVKYATDRMTIAVASDFTPEIKRATNRLREGDKISFSFSKQGRDDAKPSVLAVQYTSLNNKPLTEKQIRDNALLSIMADDIGFSAPFNLIKSDADFSRLKLQIRSEAICETTMFRDMNGFADNSTMPRSNPDFYLKIDSYNSPSLTTKGTGGVVTATRFNDAVTLSLIDRASIVNQVFLGTNFYELMRTGGKGLSEEQAREVNLKNATLIASKAMLAEFASSSKSLAITSVDGGVVTLAEPLPAALFPQARLVRPLKIGKLNKQVLLPIPADVAQLIKPVATAKTLEFKGALKTGDLLTLGVLDPNNKLLKQCDASRRNRFMAPALTHPSSADGFVFNVVGAKIKGYNLLETNLDFLGSVELALKDGVFSSSDVAKSVETPYCLIAIESQMLPKNECQENKCAGAATITSGIRIYEGATKLVESLQGANVDFSDLETDALSPLIGLKTFEYQIKSISQHKSKLN